MIVEFTYHLNADLIKNLLEKHGIPVVIWTDECGGLSVSQTFIQRAGLFVPDSVRQTMLDFLGKGNVDA